MVNIAFFWIGSDISAPTALVTSIRCIYGGAIKVYQLTDMTTPEVPGITEARRAALSPEIMMARLQASQLVPSGERTILLDSDMLVIGALHDEIDKIHDDLIVTSREADILLNHNYPEHYPEFIGKKCSEVMPYQFSFLGVFDGALFKRLEARLMSAPSRFWRWYGDQWCLKQELDENGPKPVILRGHQYNLTVKTDLSGQDVISMQQRGVRVLHFKGRYSKKFHLSASHYLYS